MASTNFTKRLIWIIGRILILFIVAIGILQSGTLASYFDPHGFFFVLVGGVALVLISFPCTEIWNAFRHAAAGSGSSGEIRNSAHFWESAGRGFWILGGLGSILSMMIGFTSMSNMQFASMSALIPMLIRTLLSTFYGGLLAVICFVPCWKLLGIAQTQPSTSNQEGNLTPTSTGCPAWRFGTIFGYVLFLAALTSTGYTLITNVGLWPVFRSPLLVVFGGTLALLIFLGWNNTRLTASTAFAGMGLIGSLMGFIQMLHGMTDPSPLGVGQVAGALAFIIFSCLIALLGMLLVGAPLEDRAVRSDPNRKISAFSRVSWYVFPLLSLIFLVLVFNMIILPLPKA
jgi:flagellar motor component MotA